MVGASILACSWLSVVHQIDTAPTRMLSTPIMRPPMTPIPVEPHDLDDDRDSDTDDRQDVAPISPGYWAVSALRAALRGDTPRR